MTKYAFKDWSIEQKWLFILLRSLLLFNNPVYSLIVLVNNWIPHLIDAIFQSTFYSLLLIFWLSIYHGIRQNDRNFKKFYLPKICLVSLIWLFSVILSIIQINRSVHDPTYSLTDENNYLAFQIVFNVLMGIYGLYLFFLVVRALSELKNAPFLDIRIKFALSLMMTVICIYTLMAITKSSADAIKQNLFEHITKNYRSTPEFSILYSLFNFYIFTLTFAYSPSDNTGYDVECRDNIAFTMLNESDEDVLYGYDTEENNNSKSFRSSFMK